MREKSEAGAAEGKLPPFLAAQDLFQVSLKDVPPSCRSFPRSLEASNKVGVSDAYFSASSAVVPFNVNKTVFLSHVTLLNVLMMTRQRVTRRTMRAGTTSVGIRKETLEKRDLT